MSRWLILSDGSKFKGHALGSNNFKSAEIVIHTAMTGYMECITDPSYRGQMLCFTYPMIGNYGVNVQSDNLQSPEVAISGLILNNPPQYFANHSDFQSLNSYLISQDIAAITGIDTRVIAKCIQKNGPMTASFSSTSQLMTVKKVDIDTSPQTIFHYRPQSISKSLKRVLLIDCGCKKSIINLIKKQNIELIIIDYKDDYHKKLNYDAIIISNGPSDPLGYLQVVTRIKVDLNNNIPIFGICLGHQILSLATGAKTYRLTKAHRSHNQPIIEVQTKRCFNSSQNHSFAVDKASISNEWEVWFENLNDGSLEGIRHKNGISRSVQFHPEGGSGPNDLAYLVHDFIQEVIKL